jgi:hypothetical protein
MSHARNNISNNPHQILGHVVNNFKTTFFLYTSVSMETIKLNIHLGQ